MEMGHNGAEGAPEKTPQATGRPASSEQTAEPSGDGSHASTDVRSDFEKARSVDDPFSILTAEDAQDLSRRERERLTRRRLMLDAARAVFAEKGYADATLDEIAQRAEFGKGTLYNYFEGGKEEILFSIFDELYAELRHLIRQTFSPELVAELSYRAVFEGFLTAIFAFFTDRHDQFMIMLKEGHRMSFNDEPATAAYFQEQGEALIAAMIPTIEAAQRRGFIRDFPPQSIAHMIMGNVKGYHMHNAMGECRGHLSASTSETSPYAPTPPADSARFLTTFLLDGLLLEQNA